MGREGEWERGRGKIGREWEEKREKKKKRVNKRAQCGIHKS